MVTAGILPFRENSHGRTGNRTRDLMISRQRLWPRGCSVSLMRELKNWKVFTSKFVGTGPSSYEKIIYWAAVSQRLRNTALEDATKVRPAASLIRRTASDGIPTHRPMKICDVLMWCQGSDSVLRSKQNHSSRKDPNSVPLGYDEAAAIGGRYSFVVIGSNKP